MDLRESSNMTTTGRHGQFYLIEMANPLHPGNTSSEILIWDVRKGNSVVRWKGHDRDQKIVDSSVTEFSRLVGHIVRIYSLLVALSSSN